MVWCILKFWLEKLMFELSDDIIYLTVFLIHRKFRPIIDFWLAASSNTITTYAFSSSNILLNSEKVVQVVKIPGHMVPLFTIHYNGVSLDIQKWEIKRLIKKDFSPEAAQTLNFPCPLCLLLLLLPLLIQ